MLGLGNVRVRVCIYESREGILSCLSGIMRL